MKLVFITLCTYLWGAQIHSAQSYEAPPCFGINAWHINYKNTVFVLNIMINFTSNVSSIASETGVGFWHHADDVCFIQTKSAAWCQKVIVLGKKRNYYLLINKVTIKLIYINLYVIYSLLMCQALLPKQGRGCLLRLFLCLLDSPTNKQPEQTQDCCSD